MNYVKQVIDGYFVHFFAPSTLPLLPKHVVFVLDTSGSMSGTRIEQTKLAMNSILDQLRAEDLFSVVEFSSEVTVSFQHFLIIRITPVRNYFILKYSFNS